jgi:hypothetical protein
MKAALIWSAVAALLLGPLAIFFYVAHETDRFTLLWDRDPLVMPRDRQPAAFGIEGNPGSRRARRPALLSVTAAGRALSYSSRAWQVPSPQARRASRCCLSWSRRER